MKTVTVERGGAPLIVSIPHAGAWLPAAIADTMTALARRLPDTDWHVDRLYGFAAARGATMVAATHARYVIDLNRPPDGTPLYAGADNTGLCPLTTFDYEPVYLPGQEPDEREIARRIAAFWRPYHDALAAELRRLRAKHERILLWDAHSIRSRVPRFFDGRLADFNLGTADGDTAAAELAAHVAAAARGTGRSTVLDGRFKGGHIVRSFGRPNEGVHAIQLETAQAGYMEENPPFRFLPPEARDLSQAIAAMVDAGLDWLTTTPHRPHPA